MQCRSKVCRGGKCAGRSIGQSCHQHSDCGDKQYCEKASIFPYLSTCQSLITAYQPCDEDAQCLHNLYCWYPSYSFSPDNYEMYNEKKPTRQCLPMYTQPKGKEFGWDWATPESKLSKKPVFKDFELNGKHCENGLANYTKIA